MTSTMSLQKEIDRLQRGVLLVVKLLNSNELSILLEDIQPVIDKFHEIVNNVCKDHAQYSTVLKIDITRMYIILNDDIKITEKLAYSIYSQIQLYIDQIFPEMYLKCSVGSIRFYPEQGIGAKKLVSLLLYGISVAKDKSYYYSYDDHPIDVEDLRRRNTNLYLLRSSLFKQHAKFLYQPIINSQSGKVEYHECLLRVRDMNNNLISIGSMVLDAESKGLVNIIDFTVVEMAILDLFNDKNAKLSVNISSIGVVNMRLLKRIQTLLKKYDVAKRLVIEITETAFNNDFENTKIFIQTLKNYGCKVAIDDFGAGFTSFRQLLELPIDIIKIDGRYISSILDNKHNKFFVEALIKLAKNLKIKTVAEFVETDQIAQCLIDMEIDAMQGNYFLHPAENLVQAKISYNKSEVI